MTKLLFVLKREKVIPNHCYALALEKKEQRNFQDATNCANILIPYSFDIIKFQWGGV